MDTDKSSLFIPNKTAFWCFSFAMLPCAFASELLVKWKDGPESEAAAAGNRKIGAVVIRNFNQVGWQHVKLPRGASITDAMELYATLTDVVSVEPNHGPPVQPTEHRRTFSLSAPITPQAELVPNDPQFNSQWYLTKIGAREAWSTTTGSTDVVVAIIDTGVD